MSELEKQLKKGVISIIVLTLIKQNDLYGYDVLKQMEIESDGYFKLKEGTVYPVLYRLEDYGYIESYWQRPETDRGVPRKYYRITDSGKRALKSYQDEWRAFIGATKKILG